MAERAPLTLAHAHARKAAKDTAQGSWAAAAEEHQHAASDFAKTARGTSDNEALRVLKLLEEQHLRLARIIKSENDPETRRMSKVDQTTRKADVPASSAPWTFSRSRSPDTQATPTSTPPKPTTSALAAAARAGRAPRDSSPALAKDIASRRGIPPPSRTQPSPAAQARSRQLSPESSRRNRSGISSPTPPTPNIPPSIVDSQAELKKARAKKKAEDDDAFAKFYSSITTGAMSKVSSAMAYAGMPISPQDPGYPEQQPPNSKRTVSANNDIDVTKIFSKAALDAVEAEHRIKRGTSGHVFGPAESFYVVQTGGGTYSYADIAKAQQQQQGHGLSEIGEEGDEDAFVDAREVPASPRQHSRTSSTDKQFGGLQRRGTFGKGQTVEELELENTTLKQTLEHLAGRPSNFEAHAQDASMAALTQSMASLRSAPYSSTAAPHSSSVASPSKAGTSAGTSGAQERIRALEDEQEKLAALSAKQSKKLQKYEAKWLELQKGARERRDRARKGDSAPGDGEGETTG